jgi:hypothetical protein
MFLKDKLVNWVKEFEAGVFNKDSKEESVARSTHHLVTIFIDCLGGCSSNKELSVALTQLFKVWKEISEEYPLYVQEEDLVNYLSVIAFENPAIKEWLETWKKTATK